MPPRDLTLPDRTQTKHPLPDFRGLAIWSHSGQREFVTVQDFGRDGRFLIQCADGMPWHLEPGDLELLPELGNRPAPTSAIEAAARFWGDMLRTPYRLLTNGDVSPIGLGVTSTATTLASFRNVLTLEQTLTLEASICQIAEELRRVSPGRALDIYTEYAPEGLLREACAHAGLPLTIVRDMTYFPWKTRVQIRGDVATAYSDLAKLGHTSYQIFPPVEAPTGPQEGAESP